MNNGYSKIRVVRTTKSRSIDFSDLISPYHNPKPITNPNPELHFKTHQSNNKNRNRANDSTSKQQQQQKEEGNEDVDGERFGVILSRNYSVSSFSAQKLKGGSENKEQKKPTLHSAVRRAFSMRKSTSVSEDYCRIHDQFDPVASPTEDYDNDVHHLNIHTGSKKKKNNRSKILKVCKGLLGL